MVLPGDFLTVGLLYDVLLDEDMHLGDVTADWDMIFSKRLLSHDLLNEYEGSFEEDDDLVAPGPDAEQSAVLYVQGGTAVEEPEAWPAEHDWEPVRHGMKPKYMDYFEEGRSNA